MKREFMDFYEYALTEWGEDSQLRMCIEEMSELTQAICKYMRLLKWDNPSGLKERIDAAKQDIRGEAADVLNMLDQLMLMFGEQEIEQIRSEKIEREKVRNGIG